MTTETVTVAFVNQPKEAGKSYGSIKTADGKFISVHRDKLGLFQKGGSYVVEYETTDRGYHNFKALVQQAGQANGHTAAPPARNEDLATAERIFVCGIVNAAVGAGHQTDWPSLVPLVNNARNAFAFTFGGRTPPQQAPAQQRQPLTGQAATGYAPMPGAQRTGELVQDSVPF